MEKKTPTVESMLSVLTEEELKLVHLACGKERLAEYRNVPCYTLGLALCYLVNFLDAETKLKLESNYFEKLIKKYKK